MAVIAVLAAQASGSAPKTPAAHSATPPKKSATVKPTPKSYPLPLHSGIGKRVVYSIGQQRVWLVEDGTTVARTYAVVAGSVRPSKGLHHVFFRRDLGKGGDGKQVEHTVLFAMTGGVNIGFSAAVDGTLPKPGTQSSAIRGSRADTAALWQFATMGLAIEVMP
ncbi:MAG: hypothetical protein HOY69_07165 [Streptomyces sp.]|nr:hypothetical protein [Streptomyces sp.]